MRRSASYAVLAASVAWAVVSRTRSLAEFRGGDHPLLFGADPYYHQRQVLWEVRNWPLEMRWDPLTGFPHGKHASQFGTLFDHAAAALSIAAGGTRLVTLLAPVLLGALCVGLAYAGGSWIGDEAGGAAAAASLALVSGTFFSRTSAGVFDHHGAEALLAGASVLLAAAAVSARSRERSLALGCASGFVFGLYLLVWPPGLVMAPLFAGTGCLLVCLAAYRGDDTGPIVDAFVAMPAVALALVLPETGLGMSPTAIGQLHIYTLAAIGFAPAAADKAGSIGGGRTAPAVFVASCIGTLAVLGALLEPLRRPLMDFVRVALYTGSPATSTIAEAQSVPPLAVPYRLYLELGYAWPVAAAGCLAAVRRRGYGGVVLAAAFLYATSMSLSQVRFHYYLAVPTAVLVGAFLAERVAPLWDRDAAACIALAVLVVGAPAASPVAQDAPGPGYSADWDGPMTWLSANSEDPGVSGSAYEPGSKGMATFYPPGTDPHGSYGVAVWWTYGHWVTTMAERPAMANPFQQNKPEMAEVFASSPGRSALVLDAMSELGQPHLRTNDELRGIATPDATARYMVVDAQTMGEHWPAVASTSEGLGLPPEGVGLDGHTGGDFISADGTPGPDYSGSLAAELYWGDADGLGTWRLIHEVGGRSVVAGTESDPFGTYEPGAAPDDAAWSREAATVKIFERVEGAVVSGEADGSTATLVLGLRTGDGRTFEYTRSAPIEDGTFEIRVSYPTSSWQGSTVEPVPGYAVLIDGEPVCTVSVTEREVQSGSVVDACAGSHNGSASEAYEGQRFRGRTAAGAA